jgi:hypothetical protein
MLIKERNYISRSVLYLLPILLIAISAVSVMAQGSVIFRCGFEGDRCGANAEIEGGSLTIVDNPTRKGNGALRVVNNDIRAELKGNGAGGPNIDGGREAWFAVSVFIPNDYKGSTSGTDMFLQIHERPDSCEGWRSPPLNFGVRGEEMWITVKWDANACSTGGGVPAGGGEKQIWKGRLADYKGRWSDWVLHTIWSYRDDGLTEAWVDDKKVVEYRGKNAYNDSKEYYWKSGSYKRFSGTTMHYMDQLAIAKGSVKYSDVSPSGNGPSGSVTPTPTPVVSPTPSTPTPTPTVTPNPPGCNSANGGSSWINNSFVNQTGTFTATFDATPSTSPSSMHVGLSNGAQTGYSGFAAIIRFNTAGNIDARNGGSYAAASAIPYVANTKYSFRVVVNVPAHTYSVYVTPAGGSQLTVGENFAFRTEQASVSQLNNWGAFTDASSGSLQVCNFQIGQPVLTLINEDCSSIANFTKVSGGTWASNNGQCTLTAAATCTSPLCNILTHNTSVSGDFTLTAEGAAAASSNAWDDFAIVFGYVDASNYYYVSLNEGDDAGTNGIFRVQAGAKTQIVDFGSNVTAPGTTLHAIKVVKTGSTVKVYKGSSLIGTLSGASFTSGKVGFASYNNNATFDNLKVTNP